MASTNIAQLRRLVLRYRSSAEAPWETTVIDADSIGQDASMTVNIAPRLRSRASQRGTTEAPIEGTMDSFSGSITMLLDTWKVLGTALRRWKPATYEGASPDAGQMTDDQSDLCGDGSYVSVISQGICDDGSTVDVELTRCQPSVDDDIEIGGTDTSEVTLNLHPIIYNPALHSEDGYPQVSYRFGDNSLTEKQRLNATTGEYAAVTTSGDGTGGGDGGGG